MKNISERHHDARRHGRFKHHGSNAHYLDKNYGAILMIWDRLFSTYQSEQEEVVYGLTKALASQNPIKVHLHEAILLWRAMRQAPT